MKKIVLFSFAFFMLIPAAFSGGIHPIDKAEKKCIDETSSTSVMLKCTTTAQNAWQKEIDTNIKLLKKVMPKDKYSALTKSQNDWEKFQKSEFGLINSIFEQKQGTMYINVSSGFRREIVKQRALDLKQYYDAFME